MQQYATGKQRKAPIAAWKFRENFLVSVEI